MQKSVLKNNLQKGGNESKFDWSADIVPELFNKRNELGSSIEFQYLALIWLPPSLYRVRCGHTWQFFHCLLLITTRLARHWKLVNIHVLQSPDSIKYWSSLHKGGWRRWAFRRCWLVLMNVFQEGFRSWIQIYCSCLCRHECALGKGVRMSALTWSRPLKFFGGQFATGGEKNSVLGICKSILYLYLVVLQFFDIVICDAWSLRSLWDSGTGSSDCAISISECVTMGCVTVALQSFSVWQ